MLVGKLLKFFTEEKKELSNHSNVQCNVVQKTIVCKSVHCVKSHRGSNKEISPHGIGKLKVPPLFTDLLMMSQNILHDICLLT